MKIGYFDLISGASGDMLLGALVDVGLPVERLVAAIQPLGLPGWELKARPVTKNGFHATQVEVIAAEKQAPERHLSEILALVSNSALPETLKTEAGAVFRRIGEVEARIHNAKVDSVHLHELSGIDTLVDVVEPYLLQIGMVARTRRGRSATIRAYDHLGIKAVPPVQPPLFEISEGEAEEK